MQISIKAEAGDQDKALAYTTLGVSGYLWITATTTALTETLTASLPRAGLALLTGLTAINTLYRYEHNILEAY